MSQTRFLILTLALLLSFSPLAEAKKHRKFKGVIIVNQILKLDGTITNNKVQALEYSAVHINDILETGDKSSAVIRIPGLAIFKMGPNTRFHLTSFGNRDESRFEIEKGSVLSLFRRPGHHIIKLAHGTLTIHGTTFFAKTDPSEDQDDVCLCDGKILAQVKGEKRTTASVAASPSPYSGPVISAEPTLASSPSVGQKTSPSPAEVIPTPTPTPPPPKEIEITSNNEHKQFEISENGIVIKELKLLDLHSNHEIQELGSLYDLP